MTTIDLPPLPQQHHLLFLVELCEKVCLTRIALNSFVQLFLHVVAHDQLPRKLRPLLKAVSQDVQRAPQAVLRFRQFNALPRRENHQVSGGCAKFVFVLILLALCTGIASVLWFYYNHFIAAWVFFGLFMVTLLPKVDLILS